MVLYNFTCKKHLQITYKLFIHTFITFLEVPPHDTQQPGII